MTLNPLEQAITGVLSEFGVADYYSSLDTDLLRLCCHANEEQLTNTLRKLGVKDAWYLALEIVCLRNELRCKP